MEPDFEIVGESGDGHLAVGSVLDARADVVLMDIELPGQDGISATAQLTSSAPAIKVVMVSLRDDPATRAEARAAGAAAFVGKHEIDFALTRAIRAVAEGALHKAPDRETPM